MSTSPSSNKVPPPYLPPTNLLSTLQPSSPRAHRTIRRLQSAQTLSSANPLAPNAPSLISQQRQQQQQAQQQRHFGGTYKDSAPFQNLPVPAPRNHHRSRSNSDAAVTSVSITGPSPKRNAAAKKILAPSISPKQQLDALIKDGPPKGDIAEGLRQMRYFVLSDGVDTDHDGMSSLRIYTWLILLQAPPLATDHYLDLIHRGPSPAYAKIRNDTFRTLATDPLFKRRVSEASLIRLLNAVAWRLHDVKIKSSPKSDVSWHSPASQDHTPLPPPKPNSDRDQPQSHTPPSSSTPPSTEPNPSTPSPTLYLQGMNVLSAPFLYAARSETEAFVAFHALLTGHIPSYIQSTMAGVHHGLALVDKCLALVDPKLSEYLLSKGMKAEIYAFPSVLTLCACTPPLPEVLRLWDFLFACGVGLNVLCVVAQVVLMRDSILRSPSPTKLLRSFPPLRAKTIRDLAVSFIPKIPEEVYEELVGHGQSLA